MAGERRWRPVTGGSRAEVAPLHRLAEAADAGAFLARLVRLDPRALVRLRADESPGRIALWARLPWGVLVSRTVAGTGPAGTVPAGPGSAGPVPADGPTVTPDGGWADATVGAAELLAELGRGGAALPRRRDAEWRWPLPPSPGTTVESIPGVELRRIAAAAAGAVRTASTEGLRGRAVGQRALRDAMLDHVAVVVTPAAVSGEATPGRIAVPQRLVQGLVRMGFIAASAPVGEDMALVRWNGRWVGLSGPYGVAWIPSVNSLAIKPK